MPPSLASQLQPVVTCEHVLSGVGSLILPPCPGAALELWSFDFPGSQDGEGGSFSGVIFSILGFEEQRKLCILGFQIL